VGCTKSGNRCESETVPKTRDERRETGDKNGRRAILNLPSPVFSLLSIATLLQYRMSAALAVIAGLHITLAVVVIEHEMLALIPDHVADSVEILCVLGHGE